MTATQLGTSNHHTTGPPDCRTTGLGFGPLVILNLLSEREADGVIELHVDDGHGCGKENRCGAVGISL